MTQEYLNGKSERILQSEIGGERRRFPTIGEEPQGKPTYEMAVSSQME